MYVYVYIKYTLLGGAGSILNFLLLKDKCPSLVPTDSKLLQTSSDALLPLGLL